MAEPIDNKAMKLHVSRRPRLGIAKSTDRALRRRADERAGCASAVLGNPTIVSAPAAGTSLQFDPLLHQLLGGIGETHRTSNDGRF